METRARQQVSELRFIVYNRALHPELFDIYHDHRIAKDHFEAQIWVTGLSHVIGFFRRDATFLEVVAEASLPLPVRGKLTSSAFRGERDQQFEHVEGIRYLSSFQVERMSRRLYAKVCGDLAEHGAKHGLLVPFPQWSSNGQVPFSYLDYEARPGQLHVFAYHAFPGESTLIKTQSIFELTRVP